VGTGTVRPAPEPPAPIRHVQDGQGDIADRLDEQCDYCGNSGSLWRWRHNGATDCWLDIDGIGPWEGWR
jgi:hypothetical protein